MNREPLSPQGASTEQMASLQSPGLAETLLPSMLPGIARQPAAAAGKGPPPAKRSLTAAEQGTVAMSQLERLSALVEREARKSGPVPSALPAALPAVQPAVQPAAPVPFAAVAPAEEESLENYLESVMKRLTGKKPEAAEQVAQPIPGMPVFAQKAAQPVQPAGPPPAPKREPSKPPECRESLTAMRELANQNARSAVAHHATNHLSCRAKLTLVITTGFSLFSCALAISALALDSRWCLWISAAAGCLAAALACRFFLLCRGFQGCGSAMGEV